MHVPYIAVIMIIITSETCHITKKKVLAYNIRNILYRKSYHYHTCPRQQIHTKQMLYLHVLNTHLTCIKKKGICPSSKKY